jgi:hypothetical protein
MSPMAGLLAQLGMNQPAGDSDQPVRRATGSQGQDLGFRGYQPSFGGGLDPSAYGPNRPLYIPQANQGAYRPDPSQGFRAYEGPFAGLATLLNMNPGNPAPGSWEYRGDPSQGFRPYEGPFAQQLTDLGVNPGKPARGSWDYKGDATSKTAPGGSFDTMSLLRQLAQQKGPRRPGR